ncbi:MAG: hypothetical protein A3I00_05945 [Betaproteobacteria bacterium RIFCSPLOWO2_02_FULL_64_12]|nr:MAG: hypothetical protein A3I00_05945 [Betaproteobacteria bacterium RIFCSPLOWO2_02_FULL_64_12]
MREKKPASTRIRCAPGTGRREVPSREAWQLPGIMSEFIEPTERPADIGPAEWKIGSVPIFRPHFPARRIC